MLLRDAASWDQANLRRTCVFFAFSAFSLRSLRSFSGPLEDDATGEAVVLLGRYPRV